jgi:N-acetyl-gamma-glutamylphosphate reductase
MHSLQSTALHESVWVAVPGSVGECVIAKLDPLVATGESASASRSGAAASLGYRSAVVIG